MTVGAGKAAGIGKAARADEVSGVGSAVGVCKTARVDEAAAADNVVGVGGTTKRRQGFPEGWNWRKSWKWDVTGNADSRRAWRFSIVAFTLT